MPKTLHILIFSLLFVLAGLSDTASAAAMSCGNKLVSEGDSKAEVLIKCGAPAWKDNWTNALITDVDTATQQRVTVARERWIYNFGPKQFLRHLLFENGKLIKIATAGYGFDDKPPTKGGCDGDEIITGLSQYEILHRCGQPYFKDSRDEQRMMTVDKHTTKLINVRIEEWTYNLGPNHFLRILRFENGELVDMENGDRGF